MKRSRTRESAAGDADPTNGNGGRHLRRRRDRAERATPPPSEPVSSDDAVEQRTNEVCATDEIIADQPRTPIEAAEQQIARQKEELLHALRVSETARAAAEKVRTAADEAAAYVQRIDDEADTLCERLQLEGLTAADAARAQDEAEAEAERFAASVHAMDHSGADSKT